MAESPLLELEESWVFGMLWPRRLRIFEDRIEISSVELLRETSETLEHGEISDVVVSGSGISASLLIKRRTGKPVLMRGVDVDAAYQAKVLVEERRSQIGSDPRAQESSEKQNTEDLIHKLADLRDAGILSPEEFEVKKRAVEEEEP